MGSYSTWSQWIITLLGIVLMSTIFILLSIPAPLLLAAMFIGIWLRLSGITIKVPGWGFVGAQGVIGCLIAKSLSIEMLIPLTKDWPIVLFTLAITLLASGLIGWILVRYSRLPGSTGAWGIAPGGASAMVLMSEDFGADVRLVALMQYLRVILVISLAALVTRFMSPAAISTESLPPAIWFAPLNWEFIATLCLIVVGVWLGRRFAIPSGAMLIPMLLVAGLNLTNVMTPEIPQWLLAISYCAIGLSVGLRFDRQVLTLAWRTLPQMLLAIIVLMLLCGFSAWLLVYALGFDPLTAYLATSPGGLDSIAIIAAGSQCDMAFIITMQVLRLFGVLLTGPYIARLVSKSTN